MTTINNNTRLDVYKKANFVTQNLYDSNETAVFLATVYGKYPTIDKYTFIQTVGDVILGFYRTTDLSRLFQQNLGVSADEAQRITSDLLEFLSPVIKREEEESNIKKEDIEKLSKTFETASTTRKKEIVPEGNPTDVQPLRTMEGDMNRIHGYGAYRQEEKDTNQTKTGSSPEETVIQSPSQDQLLRKE